MPQSLSPHKQGQGPEVLGNPPTLTSKRLTSKASMLSRLSLTTDVNFSELEEIFIFNNPLQEQLLFESVSRLNDLGVD